MGGLPDLIFVLDTVKEQIAIQEATKLNIPIAAVIDSNSNPDGITYPIPGNDDSTKAISLFCDLISKAALDGIAQSQNETSVQTEAPTKVVKKKASKKKKVVKKKATKKKKVVKKKAKKKKVVKKKPKKKKKVVKKKPKKKKKIQKKKRTAKKKAKKKKRRKKK